MLTVAFLEDFVRRLQGAQVMLLDLAQHPSVPSQKFPRWNNETRTAVFRYVWLRNRDDSTEGSSLLSVLGQVAPVIQLGDLDAALNRLAAEQAGIEYQGLLPPAMKTLSLGQ
jgi:hypothetical protein